MKWQPSHWIVLSFLLSCAPIPAQAQADDPYLRTLQHLRQTILDQERSQSAATNPAPARVPTFEELEQKYLAGKLTARQFQHAVLAFKLKRATSASPAKAAPATPKPGPALANPPKPAIAVPMTTTNLPTSDQPTVDRLAEMEARMDKILREKAERDKARTNQAAKTSAPTTKREKLNALLRELISGKITEAEYKAQWAKIAAQEE